MKSDFKTVIVLVVLFLSAYGVYKWGRSAFEYGREFERTDQKNRWVYLTEGGVILRKDVKEPLKPVEVWMPTHKAWMPPSDVQTSIRIAENSQRMKAWSDDLDARLKTIPAWETDTAKLDKIVEEATTRKPFPVMDSKLVDEFLRKYPPVVP